MKRKQTSDTFVFTTHHVDPHQLILEVLTILIMINRGFEKYNKRINQRQLKKTSALPVDSVALYASDGLPDLKRISSLLNSFCQIVITSNALKSHCLSRYEQDPAPYLISQPTVQFIKFINNIVSQNMTPFAMEPRIIHEIVLHLCNSIHQLQQREKVANAASTSKNNTLNTNDSTSNTSSSSSNFKFDFQGLSDDLVFSTLLQILFVHPDIHQLTYLERHLNCPTCHSIIHLKHSPPSDFFFGLSKTKLSQFIHTSTTQLHHQQHSQYASSAVSATSSPFPSSGQNFNFNNNNKNTQNHNFGQKNVQQIGLQDAINFILGMKYPVTYQCKNPACLSHHQHISLEIEKQIFSAPSCLFLSFKDFNLDQQQTFTANSIYTDITTATSNNNNVHFMTSPFSITSTAYFSKLNQSSLSIEIPSSWSFYLKTCERQTAIYDIKAIIFKNPDNDTFYWCKKASDTIPLPSPTHSNIVNLFFSSNTNDMNNNNTSHVHSTMGSFHADHPNMYNSKSIAIVYSDHEQIVDKLEKRHEDEIFMIVCDKRILN